VHFKERLRDPPNTGWTRRYPTVPGVRWGRFKPLRLEHESTLVTLAGLPGSHPSKSRGGPVFALDQVSHDYVERVEATPRRRHDRLEP
jgi:hypothetical protein